MKKAIRNILIALTIGAAPVAMTGCESVGSLYSIKKPESIQDSIVLAYGQITVAANLTVNLFQSQAISQAQAANIIASLQQMYAAVEQAEAVAKIDPTKAGVDIQTVLAALQVLQAELQKRGL